jgi:periplasmic glucans biosynthesis protein
MEVSRRHVLPLLGSALLPPVLTTRAGAAEAVGLQSFELSEPTPFSFDAVKREAERLARSAYVHAQPKDADLLDRIDYDASQQIRYRKERTIELGAGEAFPVQLFHLGRYAPEPVTLELVSNGHARRLIYQHELFEIPKSNPASGLPADVGFAGFRIMTEDLTSDWFSMLGASYFRSSSPFNQYGLSARGIAVNTASPVPEEFPRFTHVWLEGPQAPGGPATLYALLDGPSVAGAYRIDIQRVRRESGVSDSEMMIEANLHLRLDVDRIGVAPFSSMFWYGEAQVREPRDWRPEIHDSDGLAMFTGSGERIWRPLRNPPHITTNTFVDHNPKGFGLLQRDRAFDHYLDDGVFYDKRPSVWVEPLGDWGDGAVHLVEMATGEETWDNVVAYWCPAAFQKAGESRTFRYKLTWCDVPVFPNSLARTIGTWSGIGGPPGLSFKERDPAKIKIVIDFKGQCFKGYDRQTGVELVVSASRGTVTSPATYPVVGEPLRWRAMFDVKAAGAEPVDLRAYLKLGEHALTETWLYQLDPLTA